MAFLKAGSKFPPENWDYWFGKYDEYAAWYSGDSNELLRFYETQLPYPDTDYGKFWFRISQEERANIVHLPAANDVSTMSADLLFSEQPTFRYDEETDGGKRIQLFIKDNGLPNLLLESAEIAAALSGVFLKLNVDREVSEVPIVTIITPQQAFPTFRYGRLWEVLFFRVVKETDEGAIWRLFENRSRRNGNLIIEYKLFKGNKTKVGREVDFNSIEELDGLDLEPVSLKMDGLGCVYVPNKKPNTLAPGSSLGINDFNGCISLLDSLDFAWTSWMRDIDLGMGQLLVDEELLEREVSNTDTPTTAKPLFSKMRKAFISLNLSSWKMGGENVKPVDIVQFELRVEEHKTTCESLFSQIISQCGYSPQTFGLGDTLGRAESGTALRIRERKSLLTREKKSRYWITALWDLFWQAQQMDISSGLSGAYDVQEVDTELKDSIIDDPLETSQVLANISQAEAASTFIKVKMLHPEWSEAEVDEEVQRINDEKAAGNIPFMTEFDERTNIDEDETEKEQNDNTEEL